MERLCRDIDTALDTLLPISGIYLKLSDDLRLAIYFQYRLIESRYEQIAIIEANDAWDESKGRWEQLLLGHGSILMRNEIDIHTCCGNPHVALLVLCKFHRHKNGIRIYNAQFSVFILTLGDVLRIGKPDIISGIYIEVGDDVLFIIIAILIYLGYLFDLLVLQVIDIDAIFLGGNPKMVRVAMTKT